MSQEEKEIVKEAAKEAIEEILGGEEEKEEKRPEGVGLFDQLFSALSSMFAFSAMIPLLQQVLTQTLASTTVNVRVESSTAIIPIEVKASTAIIPIEIAASKVTLNVHIESAETLNISIETSEIAVPIDIQAATIALAIDIQATTIALPVDIQAQTINLKVDIAAQSIETIDIRIAGQIENVNITVAEQIIDVQLSGVWQSIRNLDWIRIIDDQVDVEGNSLYGDFPFSYTVPTGKRLVIMMIKAVLTAQWNFGNDAIGNRYPSFGFYPSVKALSDGFELIIEVNGVDVDDIVVTPENPVVPANLNVPIVLYEGDTLEIKPYALNGTTYVLVEIYGYEEEVSS